MIAPIHSRQPEDRGRLTSDLAAELEHLAEIVSDDDSVLARDYRDLAQLVRRRVVEVGIVDRLDQLESRLELCLADQEH